MGSPASSDCSAYVRTVSATALDIGHASGETQAYRSFVTSGPADVRALLQTDLAAAEQRLAAARTAGSVLAQGAPPEACRALAIGGITQPGVQVGQREGARAAYARYAQVLGEPRAVQAREYANLNHPQADVEAQRRAYDAQVAALVSSAGLTKIASR